MSRLNINQKKHIIMCKKIAKTNYDAMTASELTAYMKGQCANKKFMIHEFHISERTLSRLVEKGCLMKCIINREVYFRKKDVQKLLAENYVQSKIDVANNPTGDEVQTSSIEKWKDGQDACIDLDISMSTLKRYRRKGWIAYSYIGKKLYYREEDVKRVIAKNVRLWIQL